MRSGTLAIRDARGREVTQLDPWRVHLAPGLRGIEGRDLERIVNEIAPGQGRRCRLGLTLVGLGLVGLGTIAAAALFRPSAWDGLVRTVTSPAMIAPNLFWILYLPMVIIRQRRMRRHRVTAALLKHRRCPQCGYSLMGLPVDPGDGATVCPECAAAWRLDDPAIERHRTSCALAPGSRAATRWAILAMLGLAFLAGVAALLFVRG